MTTTVTSEGLRQRKKRRTQLSLQAAAIQLISENGFDGTTIEQIADAAEVSPRTFFRYFASKEAVLLTDLHDETIADHLAHAPDDVPIIDAYEAALSETLNGLSAAEWELEQTRMSLASSTPELRIGILLTAALRPLDDATEFIARRLELGLDDPRPRVYAAMLVASGAAAAFPHLIDLTRGPLDRSTLLKQVRVGLEILRTGFPTGIAGDPVPSH
jgi:AcrR family transcriptional regulator